MMSYDANDRLFLAVTLITISVFCLSFGDAVVKKVSIEISIWQLFILRSILITPLLLLIIWRWGGRWELDLKNASWIFLRSLCLVLMWIAYYGSLPHLKLSVAAAVYYTLPLFICLFAALLLNESISSVRWLAIFLGFGGVWLVLNPNASDFNWYALLPLLSAILYALAMIITRSRCQKSNPYVLSLALSATFILVGLAGITVTSNLVGPAAMEDLGPALANGWVALNAGIGFAVVVLALTLFIGSVGTAVAYQSAPSSIVSAFDFLYLPFAALWGFVFFLEVPDLRTLIGMVAIASAGVISLIR